jgi:hypothetical protein
MFLVRVRIREDKISAGGNRDPNKAPFPCNFPVPVRASESIISTPVGKETERVLKHTIFFSVFPIPEDASEILPQRASTEQQPESGSTGRAGPHNADNTQ